MLVGTSGGGYITAGYAYRHADDIAGMVSRVTRVDPQTGATKGTAVVGQSASGLSSGFDALWITDSLHGTLTRVEPETLDADAPIAVSGELDAITTGEGSVWILDSSAGVVTPVDPATSLPGSPIRVGLRPTDVAVGLGAVWVTNNGDGTISKIDPVTGNVETFEIGAPVAAIGVDEQRTYGAAGPEPMRVPARCSTHKPLTSECLARPGPGPSS